MPAPDAALLVDGREQRLARRVVVDGVEQQSRAFGRFHRREDRRGRRCDGRVERDGDGQEPRVASPVRVGRVDEQQRGTGSLERGPVHDRGAAERPALAAEPTLRRKEARQHLCFQAFTFGALEQVGPAGVDAERRLSIQPVARFGRLLQFEPQEPVGAEREGIRPPRDRRELDVADHLDGPQAVESGEVELHRLRESGQVGEAQHGLAVEAPDVGEHFTVGRVQRFERSAAEHLEQPAQRDHVAHPVQQRRGVALLRFDVGRLVAVHRVHDDRVVEPARRDARKPGVAIRVPLHRRSYAVAIAEVDVVAHPDLVAVVEDRRTGKREQQRVEQLDAPPVVVHQRSQTPADAHVDAHLRIGAVRHVHVVAFRIADHLERQLVVIAQEQSPLAPLRNAGRLAHDVGDRQPVLEPQRHEDARHQRKVERHVAFVALAEVRAHVGRPLIGLRQNHASGVAFVHLLADAADDGVCFRQVLAVGAVAFDEVRNRVEPQAVDAHVEPVAHRLQHFVDDGRIVVVEVGLVREEAMPEVGFGDRIPRPVRVFGVGEDDARVRVALVRVAPDVEVTVRGTGGCLARALEPGMLVGRVVDDQLDHHLQAAIVRRGEERLEVLHGPVVGMDAQVVGNVVPVVAQW